MSEREKIAKNLKKRKSIKRGVIKTMIHLFALLGFAVISYMIFTPLFDTPIEYQLRNSTNKLRSEYEALSSRYDTLSSVLANLEQRDRNVFEILFESEPYNFDAESDTIRIALYEGSVNKTTRKLQEEFEQRLSRLNSSLNQLNESYFKLQESIDTLDWHRNNIPAIQPIINNDLTLLTTSYGMRIHPFYRTLYSHQGVDFTLPTGSSVFATADGWVKHTANNQTTSGKVITIDHGNGYETTYSHLDNIKVRRGTYVRRGDVIALSGNTGLSLAPHLHYEIKYNGTRVDPIHYFFMELSPSQYKRIKKIAQSGMQAFD